MNRATLFPVIIVSLVVVAGPWLFSLSSDDELTQVRQLYRELLDEASIGFNTPPLERLFKAKKVAAYFADDVVGEIISPGENGEGLVAKTRNVTRERIERQLIAAYRVSTEVRPEILSEKYSKLENRVELSSTLRIYGEKPGEDVMYLEELKLQLLFSQSQGDWIIQKATVERVPRS